MQLNTPEEHSVKENFHCYGSPVHFLQIRVKKLCFVLDLVNRLQICQKRRYYIINSTGFNLASEIIVSRED